MFFSSAALIGRHRKHTATLMVFLNQIFLHPTADVSLDQGTDAVPSSSVLPATRS